MPYEERLKYLNLTTRGDLIEVFKILDGKEGIPKEKLFSHNTSITRGNSFKLSKPRTRLNVRRTFFSQRVINEWNHLPDNIVMSETIKQFKNRVDKHFKGLYGVSMTRSLNPKAALLGVAAGLTGIPVEPSARCGV